MEEGTAIFFLILGFVFMIVTSLVLRNYLRDLNDDDPPKAMLIGWLIFFGGFLIACIPFLPLLFLMW